eukprot:Hpha_TRINITY_DN9743_c0_g1::TRINITY_DN9743_c0_g1_i1::g.10439::m.10439/K10738/MCM9; DNA helicase MCM9
MAGGPADDLEGEFARYFIQQRREEVDELRRAAGARRTAWIELDPIKMLFSGWGGLASALSFERGGTALEAAERAAERVQVEGEDKPRDWRPSPVRVRVLNVGGRLAYKSSISDLRAEDVGSVVVVRGTAVRGGMPKMFDRSVAFACQDCGRVLHVPCMSPALGCAAEIANPRCCCAGKRGVAAVEGEELREYRDCQELRVQDSVTRLRPGAIPRTITMFAEDDLAGMSKAGDEVVATGTLCNRWISRPGAPGRRAAVELVLRVNRLRVMNDEKGDTASEDDARRFEEFWERRQEDWLKARDEIVNGVCGLYGMHDIKLALALCLVGGVAAEAATRAESHLLLVGDPGTAKSQFLQAAARLSSRSVSTTGIGSTAAGLTASAVKDQGEWVLDAGALVMADGGVCCIDEFNTIPDSRHTGLHEAMEQQSISIAKAGLVVKLSTRCAVIAACNPKRQQATAEADYILGVPTPLLSRFDLVFTLTDRHTPEWDSPLADFLLQQAEKQDREGVGGWSQGSLRAYFAWVRGKKEARKKSGEGVKLTRAAGLLLQAYYGELRRGTAGRGVGLRARTTVRMLESLVRVSQAHALLCNRFTANVADASVACTLVARSWEQLMADPDGPAVPSTVQSAAPRDPAQALAREATQLALGLRLDRTAPSVLEELHSLLPQAEPPTEAPPTGASDSAN